MTDRMCNGAQGSVSRSVKRHRVAVPIGSALAALALLLMGGCERGATEDSVMETTVDEVLTETVDMQRPVEMETAEPTETAEQPQPSPNITDESNADSSVAAFAPVLNELLELNERVARDGGYLDPIPGLVDSDHGRAFGYYALADINGDGVNEMFLGNPGEGETAMKSLYALVNGEPTLIEQFAGRNYAVIAQDGTIHNFRSGGATLNSLHLWRLEPGAGTLTLIREYTQDGDTYTPEGLTAEEFSDLWLPSVESDDQLVLDWRPVSEWPYETQMAQATSFTEQIIAAIEDGAEGELAALLGDPVQVYINFDAGTSMTGNNVANLLLSTVSDPREWIRQAQESSLEDDLCGLQSESDWENSPLGEWQHESPFVVICSLGGSSQGNANVGLTWAPASNGANLRLERLDIMDNTNVQEIGD